MRRFLLVANPRSGKGKALDRAHEVQSELRRIGDESKLIATLGISLMLDEVEESIRAGYGDGMILIGGDGLVHTLLPILSRSSIPFIVIPMGTGNDFARETNAFGRTIRELVDRTKSSPVEIDAIEIRSASGTKIACQVLSLGFDALVNERANSFKWVRGKAKYVLATLRELPLFKPISFSIEIDGIHRDIDAMLMAAANGPNYGGGMMICPSADQTDGYLDLLILHKVSVVDLLRVFPRVYSGSHIRHPAIEIMRCKEISVAAPAKAFADGEFVGDLPVKISVLPRALRVWK